jgi:serine/threonine protein kinase
MIQESDDLGESSGSDEGFLGRVAHAPPVAPPRMGRLPPAILERFELLNRLGSGGMGTVYGAYDRQRRMRVALKTSSSLEPRALLRFKREFRAMAQLVHPRIVRLYDLLGDPEGLAFSMELVEGANLATFLGPAPSVEKLLPTVGQILEALEFLHDEGIVHRDLKPANVLVTAEGEVKLVDFGVVAELLSEGSASGVVGTVGFMAPEQGRGERVGPAADLYSLGCILRPLLDDRSPAGVGPELTAVVHALLEADPVRRPTIAEVRKALGLPSPRSRPVAVARRGREPFVGRGDVLGRLDEALDAAAGGRTELTIIRGESGVGKSALLRAFADRARRRGFRVFAGSCYERELLPFRAFDRIVDQLAATVPDLAAARASCLLEQTADLAEVFPVWPRPLDVPPGPGRADPVTRRERAVAALRVLVQELSSEAPLLFLVDDQHWSDRQSTELLEALVASPRAARLALVAAARPESPVPAGTTRELALGPLPDDELEELASQLLGEPISADRLEALCQESGGNPFFAVQLLREREHGHDAPLSLDGLLDRNLDALDVSARTLMELISASHGPVSTEVLEEASGLDREALHASLQELLAIRLARNVGGSDASTVPGAVDAYHDRLRLAAYLRMGESRPATHRRLGEALERLGIENVDALLWHWSLARDDPKIRTYRLKGAEEAAAKLAFDEAVRLQRAALEIRAADEKPSRTAALWFRVAELSELADDYPGAADALRRARALADLTADRGLQLKVGARLAEDLVKQGEVGGGVREFERLVGPLGFRLRHTLGSVLLPCAFQRALLLLLELLPARWRERSPSSQDLDQLSLHRSIVESFFVVLPLVALEHSLHLRTLAARLEGPRPRFLAGMAEGTLLAARMSAPAALAADRVFARTAAMAGEDGGMEAARIKMDVIRAFGVGIAGQWRSACEGMERAVESGRELGISDRWDIMACRSVLIFARHLLCEDSQVRALIEGRAARGRWDILSQSFGALVEVAQATRAGDVRHAEDVLARWAPAVPEEPCTLMRVSLEIALGLVDLAAGRPGEVFQRLTRRWPAVRRSGWALADAVSGLWWLVALDAAVELQRTGTLSSGGRRLARRRARWLGRRGMVSLRPLGAQLLARQRALDGDRAAAIREARRAVELSSGQEVPFIRWRCLLTAADLGALDSGGMEECAQLERVHRFQPERAFGF